MPEGHLPTDEFSWQLPAGGPSKDWQVAVAWYFEYWDGRQRILPIFFVDELVFDAEQFVVLPLSAQVTNDAPVSEVRKPAINPAAGPDAVTEMVVSWSSPARAGPLSAANTARPPSRTK
jgi:hypothetical protein